MSLLVAVQNADPIMAVASTLKVEATPPKELRYLEPEEYPVWDQFVDASPQGSVFCHSWWLKAVGGETHVLGYFDSGKLVAGIPLYFDNQFGFKICKMPKLTQTFGPVLLPLEGKKTTVASREMEILKVLANYIATQRFFSQSFSASLRNWLPFYWKGFRQVSRITYVLDDLSDLNQIWKGMSHNIHGEICKAARQRLTISLCDVDVMYDAVIRTFALRGRNPPYSREYLKSLYFAAHAKGCGQCFATRDPHGEVHNASCLVWDHKRAFWIASSTDPNLRTASGTSLMAWHLIQFSARHSSNFDFVGSMAEPIDHFFRSFGGKQLTYHWIMKCPFWMRVILMSQRKL